MQTCYLPTHASWSPFGCARCAPPCHGARDRGPSPLPGDGRLRRLPRSGGEPRGGGGLGGVRLGALAEPCPLARAHRDAVPAAEHAESAHGLCRRLQPAAPPARPPLPEPLQVHRRGGGSVLPRVGALPPPESAPGRGGPRPSDPRGLPVQWSCRPARAAALSVAGDPGCPRPVRPPGRAGPAPAIRRWSAEVDLFHPFLVFEAHSVRACSSGKP